MQLPEQITSLNEIRSLAILGFTDWKTYGHVNVVEKDNLLLFNYTPEAQFEGRWNFFERVSRGLIIHKVTGEVIARPFDKFMNWSQNGEKTNANIVSITEKMDGSMGTLYRYHGEYRIATRGSFDSEQAIWATEFFHANYAQYVSDGDFIPNELTLIFEIIYPENRIVVDYGQRRELVLLAARNRFTGEYLPFYPDVYEFAQNFGFPTPKMYKFNDISDILMNLGELSGNEEGYVVEFSDGQRFKFKGERYLQLHKLITGLSFKSVLEAVWYDRVDEIRFDLPDEFLAQFDNWFLEIETEVNHILRNVELYFSVAPKETRKEFALYVREACPNLSPYMFMRLDGKEIGVRDVLKNYYKYSGG